MDRFRIYRSALNDVRYIFGRPLSFEPKLAKERESNFVIAVREFEERRAEAARKAAERS